VKVIQLFTNEKKLIDKATAGDRKAQKHLYDKHAPKMLSICRQYLSPLEAAEDAMIHGFFKAFTKLEGFNHEGSFEGWLRRIMVRGCIDILRKKDPFKFKDEINDDSMESQEELDDCDEDQLPMDILQECIDNLPDGYKSIFIMYAIDGYKHREIAQLLSISENTSKSQFRKARLELQEQITQIKKKRYEA
jgi:RNA polymerase sigma-70 factor (ECF subfamily)